jgi:hypothetical protein
MQHNNRGRQRPGPAQGTCSAGRYTGGTWAAAESGAWPYPYVEADGVPAARVREQRAVTGITEPARLLKPIETVP